MTDEHSLSRENGSVGSVRPVDTVGSVARLAAPTLVAPPPALAVAALSFAYPGSAPVLQAVSLTVQAGERVGIVGPNGAGKTTFFMLLCGILSPATGTIMLSGAPVKPGAFRPEIGMVFQHPDDQLFCASVWEDVAFGPQNLGLAPAEVSSRVAAALALTGMQELARRPPHRLSGGEKRMVAIAGVLAMQPHLVIYDEPGVYLDMRARRRLIQFLQAAPETFLLAAHDLDLIIEVCERVVVFDAGQIVADGPAHTILADASLLAAHGLECPARLQPRM